MERVQCGVCQHSVRVRGIGLVACLPYLDMRDPAIDRTCADFEGKTSAPESEGGTLSAQTEKIEQQEPEES